jgi:hypothetical protein
MLYREIIAVCSQTHTKHIQTQSVPRSKHTPSQLFQTNQLMLYREIIAVYCDNPAEHINALCGPNWVLTYWKAKFLPRRELCVSITKSDRLILFRGIMAVYSENHTTHNKYTVRATCWVYYRHKRVMVLFNAQVIPDNTPLKYSTTTFKRHPSRTLHVMARLDHPQGYASDSH